ncbi:hypothetical protein MMC11_002696 [Xylographa trunciseda]|nr:hypothetical protein [Xylographa trunciseda]
MSKQAPAGFSQSHYGGPIISVILGSGNQSTVFNVHRDLICAESKYFAAACSEPWLVGSHVCLSEDDPAIFEQFLNWLYAKSYTGDAGGNLADSKIRTHFLLCVLADKLQVTKLINQMGDWIDKQLVKNWDTNKELPWSFIVREAEAQYVYENTLPSSRPRISVTRFLAKEIGNYDEDYWREAMRENSEFAFDRATALRCRLIRPELFDENLHVWL